MRYVIRHRFTSAYLRLCPHCQSGSGRKAWARSCSTCRGSPDRSAAAVWRPDLRPTPLCTSARLNVRKAPREGAREKEKQRWKKKREKVHFNYFLFKPKSESDYILRQKCDRFYICNITRHSETKAFDRLDRSHTYEDWSRVCIVYCGEEKLPAVSWSGLFVTRSKQPALPAIRHCCGLTWAREKPSPHAKFKGLHWWYFTILYQPAAHF